MRRRLVSTLDITYQDIHDLLTGLGFSLEIRVPERSVNVIILFIARSWNSAFRHD